MRVALVLAGLLLLTPVVNAQVREVMSPPASAGVPDTEYSTPDTSNGIDNFDSDWSSGLNVEAVAPAAYSGGDSGGVTQGPDVVEGTNDGPYVPSTFVSYQDALEEGEEELAEMGSVAKAEAAQTRKTSPEPKPPKPSEPASKPAAANVKDSPKKLQPIVVPRESVAEAAREYRERQASREGPKAMLTQDANGQPVVVQEPQKSGPQTR